MVDELDIHNELPFSPGEGWMEMETLLNKNLPVHKKTGLIGLLRSCLLVMLLSGIFLFSSLQLDTVVMHPQFTGNSAKASSATATAISSLTSQHKNYTITKGGDKSIAIDKNKNVTVADNNELQTGNMFDVALTNRILEKSNNENIVKAIIETKNRGSIIKSTAINTQSGFPMKIVPGQYKKTWELAGGIGINIAAGKQQDLQPYPVAELKYNLNTHVFVAAGLSLFSPAPGSVSGVSKTVYLNDTVNDIRLYNEQVSYNRFRYADVPVFVGMNISRKISFQAGLQASFLLSKKEKRSLQPYDFQMNNISVPVDRGVLEGMAANPQQEFEVRVRNIDYRFIAGIKYRQNRMSAGLFYQHGLQSTGIGSNTSKNKNQLFTLNLLYQLK